MTEDLIARLKAAHEAARTPGDPSYQLYMAEVEDKLFRENATEIIAALEERERLRAVVEAARLALDQYDRDYAPGLERFFHDSELREALDALEKKG